MEKYDLKDGVLLATSYPITEEFLFNLFKGQSVHHTDLFLNKTNFYYYFIQNINGTIYCRSERSLGKSYIRYEEFIDRYVPNIHKDLEKLDRIIKEKENG